MHFGRTLELSLSISRVRTVFNRICVRKSWINVNTIFVLSLGLVFGDLSWWTLSSQGLIAKSMLISCQVEKAVCADGQFLGMSGNLVVAVPLGR